MTKETYVKIYKYFTDNKIAGIILKAAYKYLPVVIAVAYPLMVIYIAFTAMGHKFILSLVIPAITLFGSALIRKLINRPRPYEKFQSPSFIEKDRVGQSFPSNHASCAFVIAMTGFSVNSLMGCTLIIIAIIIALSRIFAGVHFISDVLAGTLLGILAGFIFLFI